MVDRDEADRRRAVATAGGTDRARWSDPAQLEAAWDARARYAAQAIPDGARVLDLGCGAMALEGFLPPRCAYIPCDLTSRDARTVVCDFNAGEFPAAVACDVSVALGVLEYLVDVPAFLGQLRALGKPAVISYNFAGEGPADRRALGWLNDYARPEFQRLLVAAGFSRAVARELGGGQLLLRLEPVAPPRRAEKSVWVVSYSTVGNFGDRLGVQLLSQVVPGHARVRHISHGDLATPVDETPDLVILGLGNSLYAPLLTDELSALLARAPRRIGIFGTQYRQSMPEERLAGVIDGLDAWYARYEEDALIYGRGRDNVRHLGDWLIDAFPMTRPSLDAQLDLRPSDVANLPLDRLIAHIQSYRTVTSSRLHPLLCALTSAEAVAYAEQEELPGGGESGKFRSMLLDVFGWRHPPGQLWRVDREAVIAYKARVAANIAGLRAELARVLD